MMLQSEKRKGECKVVYPLLMGRQSIKTFAPPNGKPYACKSTRCHSNPTCNQVLFERLSFKRLQIRMNVRGFHQCVTICV